MFKKTQDNIVSIIEKLLNNQKDFSGLFISCIGYNLIKTYANTFDLKLLDYTFDDNVDGFLSEVGFYDNNFKLDNVGTKERITPIYSINDFGEVETISANFYERLQVVLGDEYKDIIKELSNAIFELLNNIEHHSGGDLGEIARNFSSAQIYKGKGFLQIAIVDSGIGLLSSVRKKDNTIQTADKAILKALEKGFTGKTQLINQGHHNKGLGLNRTKEIIQKLKGDLFIGSLNYLYCYNGKKDKYSFVKLKNNWRGTFIVINIYYDDIGKINKNEYNIYDENLDNLFM